MDHLGDGGRQGSAIPTDVSVRQVVLRFTAVGVLAMLLVALASALISRRIAVNEGIDEARRVTWLTGMGVIEPNLDEALLAGDPDALAAFDELVRSSVLRGSLVRVKLWDGSGRIVYSDEPRVIGAHFDLDDDARRTLAEGGGAAEVSDLSAPENHFEAPSSTLLESYSRVVMADGTPLLFEAYFQYNDVVEAGRTVWFSFVPVFLGGLGLLQLVQIPLAWSMARRLRASQSQRERLLRHAVDASQNERRRIASDLHDGVVQDLTGVSYSLAAAQRRGEADLGLLDDASSRIRESIGSLRSLLVEIYPPNLQEEGLESALSNLLSQARNRGIDVELSVQLPDTELPPELAALVYRAAQEALRNVMSHADARRVVMEVTESSGRLLLYVEDDGRGFDPAELDATRDDGHVGLRVLGDLAAEWGGSVRVDAGPGAGTRLNLEVPV